ncbi:hypothetical protein BLX41_24880 [Pseudomonas protegens]|uniref:hypothetical protein n=1 Tax=Pseudomonas protegens TaxID=380021 RepID=UPI000F4BCAA7|nr:hypothetical protein [Pseudomonas protegens]ROL65598.1 hypothetical protein BLX41_24880 [Pseudomonas protegens]
MVLNAFSSLQRALRALLVIGLSACAHLLTRVSIRLYVRGLLSAVEIRFLLGFSAAITRASLRLAIA